jgi:hypothetical protein
MDRTALHDTTDDSADFAAYKRYSMLRGTLVS